MVVLHYIKGPANVHQTKEHAYRCGAEITLPVRANQHSAKTNPIAVLSHPGKELGKSVCKWPLFPFDAVSRRQGSTNA
jgi:hypothetical protein